MNDNISEGLMKDEYLWKNGSGHCNICFPTVSFTSVNSVNHHLDGSKHKKALEYSDHIRVLGYVGNKSLQNAATPFNDNAEMPTTSVAASVIKSDSTNVTTTDLEGDVVSDVIETSEYKLDRKLGKGHCYICNVQLSSMKQAEDHFKGSGHEKKKNRAIPTASSGEAPSKLHSNDILPPHGKFVEFNIAEDGPGECYMCEVQLLTFENIHQHLKGKKHLKCCSNKGVISWWGAISKPQPSECPLGHYYEYNLFDETEGEEKSKCKVCNVDFTSIDHATSHLKGKNHRKKCQSIGVNGIFVPLKSNIVLRASLSSEGTPTPSLQQTVSPKSNENPEMGDFPEYQLTETGGKCKICCLDFTSSIHGMDHLRGSPHGKTKKRFNMTKKKSPADDTYMCCMCNEPFASEEDMDNHLTTAHREGQGDIDHPTAHAPEVPVDDDHHPDLEECIGVPAGRTYDHEE